MSKRRHHYVPQFYLRSFAAAPRRIHLFNHRSGAVIRNASLKEQCYRHRYYGDTDELEDAFAEVEGYVAPIVAKTVESALPPAMGSLEHAVLLNFVALQLHRTVAAADRIDETADQMTKAVFHDDPRLAGSDLSKIRVRSSNAIIESLAFAKLTAWCLSDLALHVLVSPDHGLITSDDPVVKYNKYCEGIRYMGVLGGVSRGLLIFVPLSPGIMLVMYDDGVYKLGARGHRATVLSSADAEALNVLQVLNSVDNIYFSRDDQATAVAALAKSYARKRTKTLLRTDEFAQVGDERRSLIHAFEASFKITLELSVLSIRRAPRRTPLRERAQMYRKQLPLPEQPPVPDLIPGTRFHRGR